VTKTTSIIFIFLCVTYSYGFSKETWICKAENIVGLKWNEESNKYINKIFRPNLQYVFKEENGKWKFRSINNSKSWFNCRYSPPALYKLPDIFCESNAETARLGKGDKGTRFIVTRFMTYATPMKQQDILLLSGICKKL